MAQVALPGASTFRAAVLLRPGSARALVPLLLVAGCASLHPALPIPPEVTQSGVAARLLVPPDLNVNPAETVLEPDIPGQAPTGSPGPTSHDAGQTIFALRDAIAFALRSNPRLRSARAALSRAQGQEQVAFAPFLPEIDLLGQYGVVSPTLAPGTPGPEGFILASSYGTRSYAQAEVGLEWTLYD
jgi:outer membrane protein TolC